VKKIFEIIGSLKEKYNSLALPVKAALWFFVCTFLQRAISAISTPIFTRLLTTEEYGQYNVFVSWESILAVVVTLSLSSGVYMQGLDKFEDKRDEYTSSLQGLTLLLVSGAAIVYVAFSDFFNSIFSLTTPQMLMMFIFIWSSAVFAFWSAYQRVDYKYKMLVIVTLSFSLLQPIVSVICIMLSEDKVTARIFGQTVVSILFFAVLFVTQMKKGKVFYNKTFWKHALMFNLPLIPHYLSNTILNSADRIMISKMVGDREAGIYGLAYSVAILMTMFNLALQQTLEPWRYKKQKSGEQKDMAPVAYSTMILIAILNVLFIAFAPEIIAIFAPGEYMEAIWIVPTVSMSTFFMYMFGWYANFEFYYEKTKYIMIATSIGAIFNIVLNYIFIGIFGYMAAGYTTLVCYIIYAMAHYYFMRKICKQKLSGMKVYDVRIIIGISIVFLLCGFGLQFTYMNSVVRYTIILLMFALILAMRKTIYGQLKKIVLIKKENG